MPKSLLFVACVLALNLVAQDGAGDPRRSATRSIASPSVASVAEKQSKLSSDLRELVTRFHSGRPIETSSGERPRVLASGNTIQVVIQTTTEDGVAVRNHLQTVGGQFETAAGNLVVATVPISRLDSLANAGPAIQMIRRPRHPVPLRTTSEGVNSIGAAAWHSAGRKGGGIKVAILDVGFDGYRSLMGSDLPQIPDARVRSFSGDITGDGSEHGTGVAEIVHDVAPEAILYLVNFSNEVELENAVDWLIQERVDVINSSWAYPCAGPVDGTGFVNDLVKRASDAGILWVAAAGNFAQQHWTGEFQDSNGDKWHNFTPTQEGNTVYMGSGDKLRVCVEWDDWTSKNQDLDLFVWDSFGSVVASSDENQSGPSTHDPWERLEFTSNTAGNYYIGIKRYSGSRNLRMHLYAYEPGAECAVETLAATQAVPKGILEELRQFRNDVLAASPAGQELIRLYYRHSGEVRRILLRHPSLGLDAARLLVDLRPAVRSVLNGSTTIITQDHTSRIDAFVAELADLAGPELREALTELRARARISSVAGQPVSQYWDVFLNEEQLHPRPTTTSSYPEAGFMLHRVEQSSLTPPADSAHALTIGAVNVGNGAVRDFSSRGPTADGRRKPDLGAPDGVCTTTYGECGTGGVAGTSIAAPHAAGAVALVRNAYPSLSNFGVRDFLLNRTTDVAPSGPDNVTGAGLLALEGGGPNLFAPPALSGPKGSGISLSPTYVWSEISGATSYQLMVASSIDALTSDPASQTCTGCVVNTTRTAAYFVPFSCLIPDTTYYWQVQAIAGSKRGIWARSSFMTGTAPEKTLPVRGDLNENPGTLPLAARAVVITHGYNADATTWVQAMATGICVKLGGSGAVLSPGASLANSFTRICKAGGSNGWDVWVVDWRGDADLLDGLNLQLPTDVLPKAAAIGERLASRLRARNYEHVHLIAHSAGSQLIQSTTAQLKRTASGVRIHNTFLDAFDPGWISRYGNKADWADNYVDTRPLIGWIGIDGTKLFLDHAFNVNVTPAESAGCGMTCRHDRPYRFYGKSINDSFADLSVDPIGKRGGMGFDLSTENEKTLVWLATNYPKNLSCTVSGDACDYSLQRPASTPLKNVKAMRSGTRLGGPVTFTPGSASLFDSIKFGSASLTGESLSDRFSVTSPESPAWIVVDVSIPEPVSTLRFHWRFRTAGQGFLRVFVDGRLVREMDQRHLLAMSGEAEEFYIGGPEGTLEPGSHTIVFRLDGFAATASGLELTNVQLVGTGPAKRRTARH